MANRGFINALACCKLLAKLPPEETQLIAGIQAALTRNLIKATEATADLRNSKWKGKLYGLNYLRFNGAVVNCLKLSRYFDQDKQSQNDASMQAARPACNLPPSPDRGRPVPVVPRSAPAIRPSASPAQAIPSDVPQPQLSGEPCAPELALGHAA